MTLTYERTFAVRYYECDGYGHVNHANYLRYMQETTALATTAAGRGVAEYAAIGRKWFIREIDITYKRPLLYGDSVVVRSWPVDVRRVRFWRRYEMRDVASGEVVADGVTNWVYLDSQTSQPVTIPSEMIERAFPDGPPPAKRPEPFPTPPPAPAGVFVVRRPVAWLDIDPAGHVNNAMYLTYCEDCIIQATAAFGWPMTRLAEMGIGIGARRYRIEYKEGAKFGDTVQIGTWASKAKRVSALRHYEITRVADGKLLARAQVLYAWVDLKTGQPVRIPKTLLADFAPNIVEDA